MEIFLSKFRNLSGFDIKSIRKINTPNEFKDFVCENLKEASVCFMMSLYIGNGEKSMEIFDALVERKVKNLETVIVLDKNRGKRNREILNVIKDKNLEDFFYFYDFKKYYMLPAKIRELLYVYHPKVYIFDSNVILTGANLHDTYFSNRIDRYFVVESEKFSDYLKNEMFYKILPSLGNYTKLLDNSSFVVEILTKTYILMFDNRQEEEILRKILLEDFQDIFLSTAYLNFPEAYFDLFNYKNISIVTAGPECNTFDLNNKNEKYIVQLYSLSAYKTLDRLNNMQYYEFGRKDTTFHFKGLWAFSNGFALTVIGSTNFNLRSNVRDEERNFLIVTKDEKLIQIYKEEIKFMLENSRKVELEELKNRKPSLLSKISYHLFHRYF
ncbi:CDP-diacylglycerol--glycerol-3-phosphate 3-phosphatidyltransferase, variant 2 [Hamiltosporidium tvaerminnensis]|nr:CDP-diacylglycerol--glycerol-3-phosphate 3-phosphatidyltransferase, variant 2 [Hamiltosporidium tvaerminnensis]